MAKGAPVNELPLLDVQEHAELERAAGRSLTNDEAQTLRRERVNHPPCGRTHCLTHAVEPAERQARKGEK